MKTIERVKRDIVLDAYRNRSATDLDYEVVIKESALLVSEGKIKAIYMELGDVGLDATPIAKALKKIKYIAAKRSRGLTSYSRIFGYAPRLEFRQNFCHITSLAKDQPLEHKMLCDFGKELSKIYQKQAPEVFKDHEKEAEKIMEQYRLEGSPFTSGIVNKNSALKYHNDSGNFRNVYSCMLGFKHNISGGYLSLPEYGVAFEIKDNSVFIFDGQNILHGVTPIKYLSEDAYRFTIVYYTLKRMWECKTIEEEIERIRNIQVETSEKRAKGILAPAVLAKLKKRQRESLGKDVRG